MFTHKYLLALFLENRNKQASCKTSITTIKLNLEKANFNSFKISRGKSRRADHTLHQKDSAVPENNKNFDLKKNTLMIFNHRNMNN